MKDFFRRFALVGGVLALLATLFSLAPAPAASAQTVVSPNGYAVLDGIKAGYPDRTIRFFPSVPLATRQKFLSVVAQYNTAGARIKFGPDTTFRSFSPTEITVEVVPGPFYCGTYLARACTYSQYGFVAGQRVPYATHMQFGSHILGKSEELKTLLHETGHAFGLSHYEQLYSGQSQVMSIAVMTQNFLLQGDINGVRAMTRKFDNPIGSLDVVAKSGSGVMVGGWALDSNNVSQSIDVHMYVNGKYSTKLVANGLRSDVRTALRLPWSNTGYSGVATVGVKPGVNSVCVYAINVGPGTTNPALGCKLVVV